MKKSNVYAHSHDELGELGEQPVGDYFNTHFHPTALGPSSPPIYSNNRTHWHMVATGPTKPVEAPQVLVTGGLGYIGSHVVVALHEAGYVPFIVDILKNEAVLDGLKTITGFPESHFICGDCRDEETAVSIAKKGPFHGVIHLAAYKSVPESENQPLRYFNNNLLSLIQMLDQGYWYPIKKFIFSSSCAVYGQVSHDLNIKETLPCNPVSVYGLTKLMGEQILEKSRHVPSRVSLRYFNPIGAHESGLIGDAGTSNVMHFLTKEEFTVYGTDYNTRDGSCVRDYIHVLDLAQAHVCALQAEDGYWVYNIGTGKGTTVKELVKAYNAVAKSPIGNIINGPRRPGDVAEIYNNSSSFQKKFDWKASLTIKDAVASHLNFLAK